MYAGSSPSSRAFDEAAMRIEPPVHLGSMPTRVIILRIQRRRVHLLRYWKILATLLASTAPHPIAVIPIFGSIEIGFEGANWTDSGNLAGGNADAGREDRNLELFSTEVPKDEITAVQSKTDRRAKNTSRI